MHLRNIAFHVRTPRAARLDKPTSTRGFTLSELLIALALTGMAVTVVGGIIINQLRQNIIEELKQQLVNDWGRVGDFISEELFSSERAYPVDSTSTASEIIGKASLAGNSGVCGFTADEIRLSLVLHDASTYISYAVSPITSEELKIWRGPYLLKRCGPPNVNSSNPEINQSSVLVGNLPNKLAFSASRGTNALGGALAARDILIQLTLAEESVNHSGSMGGQARVSPSYNLYSDEATTGDSCNLPSNQTALLCGSGTLEFTPSNCPDYSGPAITRSAVSSPSSNCGLSRVHQFKPLGSATVIGSKDSSVEDAIYFSKNRSDYSINPLCNRASCTVTSSAGTVLIRDGNVLVFRDREIRL